MFGVRIETLMLQQRGDFPELDVPRVLVVLTQQLRAHGAFGHEGVFRVPGRHDVVATLKARLNAASASSDLHAVFAACDGTDVNALASLLKMWFRELPTPIIPADLYDVAVRGFASEPDSQLDDDDSRVDRALSIFRELPLASRRVLAFVLRFLDEFSGHAAHTRMSETNIAMVFVPSLLASPSTSVADVATAAHSERRFVLALMAAVRRLDREEHREFLAANPTPPPARRTSRQRANAVAATPPSKPSLFTQSLDLNSLSAAAAADVPAPLHTSDGEASDSDGDSMF